MFVSLRGGRERGREGERERGREGGREGGREREREEEREGGVMVRINIISHAKFCFQIMLVGWGREELVDGGGVGRSVKGGRKLTLIYFLFFSFFYM